jgi:hypothetical protein
MDKKAGFNVNGEEVDSCVGERIVMIIMAWAWATWAWAYCFFIIMLLMGFYI